MVTTSELLCGKSLDSFRYVQPTSRLLDVFVYLFVKRIQISARTNARTCHTQTHTLSAMQTRMIMASTRCSWDRINYHRCTTKRTDHRHSCTMFMFRYNGECDQTNHRHFHLVVLLVVHLPATRKPNNTICAHFMYFLAPACSLHISANHTKRMGDVMWYISLWPVPSKWACLISAHHIHSTVCTLWLFCICVSQPYIIRVCVSYFVACRHIHQLWPHNTSATVNDSMSMRVREHSTWGRTPDRQCNVAYQGLWAIDMTHSYIFIHFFFIVVVVSYGQRFRIWNVRHLVRVFGFIFLVVRASIISLFIDGPVRCVRRGICRKWYFCWCWFFLPLEYVWQKLIAVGRRPRSGHMKQMQWQQLMEIDSFHSLSVSAICRRDSIAWFDFADAQSIWNWQEMPDNIVQ